MISGRSNAAIKGDASLTRVEKLAISSGTDLINDGRLQIDKDSAGNMLASAGLAEERIKGVVYILDFTGNVAIRLDTVLKAVEFPAGVTDLDTCLADVDGNNFTHLE